MKTLIVCPKCYSIHLNEIELTEVKVIGELIIPENFIYIKVIPILCNNCKL